MFHGEVYLHLALLTNFFCCFLLWICFKTNCIFYTVGNTVGLILGKFIATKQYFYKLSVRRTFVLVTLTNTFDFSVEVNYAWDCINHDSFCKPYPSFFITSSVVSALLNLPFTKLTMSPAGIRECVLLHIIYCRCLFGVGFISSSSIFYLNIQKLVSYLKTSSAYLVCSQTTFVVVS